MRNKRRRVGGYGVRVEEGKHGRVGGRGCMEQWIKAGLVGGGGGEEKGEQKEEGRWCSSRRSRCSRRTGEIVGGQEQIGCVRDGFMRRYLVHYCPKT